MSHPSYEKLVERCREIALYQSTASLLGWDQETCLPKAGQAYRAEQCAFFGGKMHRLFTAPEVGGWIADCEASPGEAAVEAANVRDWRWSYERATRLSAEFVEETERVRAIAMPAWGEARERSEFSLFRPHLEKIVGIERQRAELLGYVDEPYDALLESYERGATTAAVGELFAQLKPQLVEIGAAAAARSADVPADLLAGDYPIADQQVFNRQVAAAFGFDFEAGRIDTAAHPFCSGLAPGDTRLTTRYDEGDFCSSLYGVLHEAGHGLYEQGLPAAHYGTPAGAAVSLGIHESQSRLWENHVGRGAAFWEHWFPRAERQFEALQGRSAKDLAAFAGRSAPSFIRVEADEASYDLHIILRFEVERALVGGALEVADLPDYWNAKFEEFFGLRVGRDADGCLQDIHWSMGALGYFPTYTLGNLAAAQLFSAACEQRPEIPDELAAGHYAGLLEWLREKVHRHGGQLLPPQLIEAATGQPLSADAHLAHLRRRYL